MSKFDYAERVARIAKEEDRLRRALVSDYVMRFVCHVDSEKRGGRARGISEAWIRDAKLTRSEELLAMIRQENEPWI